MRVLVVGGGGREHALCHALRRGAGELELFCAPGNPGIGELAANVPIAIDEVQRLADFATELAIDLTVVGPELPLSLGVVDEFEERGLLIFGPRQAAARLESSKAFAKEFMRRHDIPTADADLVYDRYQAEAAVERLGLPLVLKADGLAGGKGVLLARDRAELDLALRVFFDDRRFAQAATQVVVEDFLDGEEVSFMALSDGRRVLPLATSKDYKRLLDGDLGPNTGGMGAHSPAGVMRSEDIARVLTEVMHRAVVGMADEGNPFRGVLYAGIMLTADGPKVLEFNALFGDPECQALLLRFDGDLGSLLRAGARGDFGVDRLHFRREAAACVVLASRGYPDKPARGEAITGIEAARRHEGVSVYHAGTRMEAGRLLADGGRVLNVCATGADLREALRRSYAAAAEIEWPAKTLRYDVGRKVIEGGVQPSAEGEEQDPPSR